MALWKINDDNLTAIADKLREVGKNENTYTIDQMPQAIANLKTGVGDVNIGWDNVNSVQLDITQSFCDSYKFCFRYRMDPSSSITVDWGDGSSETYSATNYYLKTFTHNYSSGGTYQVTTTGSGTYTIHTCFYFIPV